MKKDFVLKIFDDDSFRLRCILEEDIEELRQWKNNNVKSFFYQKIISPEQQKEWYKNYLERTEDFIFVAEIKNKDEWQKFGCLGYRLLDEKLDLYNIIRGYKTIRKSSMKVAMAVLISYLCKEYTQKIQCDVLIDNAALLWYNKCGFSIKQNMGTYYVLEIDRKTCSKIKIIKEEVQND